MSSEVYIVYVLDWQGAEILDVFDNEADAEVLREKFKQYANIEKRKLPEGWPVYMAVPYMEWLFEQIYLYDYVGP